MKNYQMQSLFGYSSSRGCWLSEYKSYHGRFVHPHLEWIERSARCLSISMPAQGNKSMYGHSMGFHSLYILLVEFSSACNMYEIQKNLFSISEKLIHANGLHCKTLGKVSNAVFLTHLAYFA